MSIADDLIGKFWVGQWVATDYGNGRIVDIIHRAFHVRFHDRPSEWVYFNNIKPLSPLDQFISEI